MIDTLFVGISVGIALFLMIWEWRETREFRPIAYPVTVGLSIFSVVAAGLPSPWEDFSTASSVLSLVWSALSLTAVML